MSEVKTDKISSVSTNGDITLDPDGTGAVVVDAPIKLDGNYPTGTENVALGNQALDDGSLSGSYNTAIGHNSLSANTSGTRNTAVGRASMVSNTTGGNNVAVGFSALEGNTTASNNTAVGYNALAANTTGYSNTVVGNSAGDALTTAANCTMMGQDAGTAMTTGDKNTFFGQQAGSLVTTGSKHTVVGRYNGNNSGLDIRTATNQIVLADGDGNARLWIDGNNSTTSWSSSGNGVNVFRTSIAAGTSYNLIQAQHSSTNIGTGGTQCFFMTTNGNMYNTNNSYNGTSDSKLKENIVDATSQWDDIKAMQIRKYNMIGDDTVQLGVIAQELETAGMNGLVTTRADRDEDGNDLGTTTKSVKYSVLYMKAVKALQEAMTRIETLETENTTQATQIADLITRVTALEDA